MSAPTLSLGMQYHLLGNFAQAERLYRQVLDQDPQSADALNLLGLAMHQRGDSQEGIGFLEQAVALSPDNADYLNNLGELYRGVGDLPRAQASFERALDLNPGFVAAHYNLGNVYLAQGKLDLAWGSFHRALEIKPTLAPAYNNLGIILKQQGNYAQAVRYYQQALALKPDYPQALNNLGVAQEALGEYQAALECLQKLLKLTPNDAAAHNNLGIIWQKLGKLPQSIGAFHQAIALDPTCRAAYLNLGNVLKLQGNFQQVESTYRRLTQTLPQDPEAPCRLGHLYREQGDWQTALAAYHQALAIDPAYPEAFWSQALLLPILYDTPEDLDHWRQRFERGLVTVSQAVSLGEAAGRRWAMTAISNHSNFFLQYQGQDDRPLQQQYGQLLHQIMTVNYPEWAQPVRRLARRSRPRIGFFSYHWRQHTVSKLFLGWLRHWDREQFDLYGYHSGPEYDQVTEEARQCCKRFYHLPRQFEGLCQQIRSDHLDVLIFTDLGMDMESQRLAALRLAPIQCVAWGHPVTSGLPTVDYFLSGDLMEPDEGQDHYTEKLVRLPGLGIAYRKPDLPAQTKTRGDFSLASQGVLYLCCQSLYKYLPQYDLLLPRIAQRVPQAQFVFLASPTQGDTVTRQFQRRLAQAFRGLGLAWEDWCQILPQLNFTDYLNLNRVCDVFLDSLGWSGGNTTLEAIACGLPVVTCPGPLMRSRHTQAMLQILQVPELIAPDQDQYVEIATRLGLDPNYRRAVVEKMATHQSSLYEDTRGIRALEEFLRRQVPQTDLVSLG